MSAGSGTDRLFWGAAVAVIVVDFFTKKLAVEYLTPHVPQPVVGEFARLTLAFNPGAAFSMSLGPYSRHIFGAFAIGALVILWMMHRWTKPSEIVRALALGLAWGGAAGNLIDRFISPAGVVDFIDIGVGDIRFWTFNVADSGVTIGALLLAFVLWREDRRTLAINAAAAAALDTVDGKPSSP